MRTPSRARARAVSIGVGIGASRGASRRMWRSSKDAARASNHASHHRDAVARARIRSPYPRHRAIKDNPPTRDFRRSLVRSCGASAGRGAHLLALEERTDLRGRESGGEVDGVGQSRCSENARDARAGRTYPHPPRWGISASCSRWRSRWIKKRAGFAPETTRVDATRAERSVPGQARDLANLEGGLGSDGHGHFCRVRLLFERRRRHALYEGMSARSGAVGDLEIRRSLRFPRFSRFFGPVHIMTVYFLVRLYGSANKQEFAD